MDLIMAQSMLEKRARCNVVLVAMVLNVWLAQAVEVGIVGGIRTTDDFFSPGYFSPLSSESKRYIVGPAVNIGLPKRFSVEVDALYQRSGYTVLEEAGENFSYVRERANSWEFPVILKYHLPVKLAHPFVGIGYAPRIVHGTDSWWGESAGCFCYISGRGPANYPVMQGVVVSGGASVRAGHFVFTPEVRYTHWNGPYLNTYFVASNEASVLLGIRWH
jgi:hypothetical protein